MHSGNMLYLRSKGCWFMPHPRHCIALEQETYPLLSTGSTQEKFQLDWKIVDWGVKHQRKQTKTFHNSFKMLSLWQANKHL